MMMKTAVEWAVIERIACSIRLLRTPKGSASFLDFEEYERLVNEARSEPQTYVAVLLGGEAGMRCGEIMALEWSDIDLQKRQLCVARSDWKGHVTAPKGGRLRYVPLTKRLTEALQSVRHLRGPRVLCDVEGKPLTQKVVQVMLRDVRPGVRTSGRASTSFATHSARTWRCVERRRERFRSSPGIKT